MGNPRFAIAEASLVDYTGVAEKAKIIKGKRIKREGYYGKIEKSINYGKVYSFVAAKPIYFLCRLKID